MILEQIENACQFYNDFSDKRDGQYGEDSSGAVDGRLIGSRIHLGGDLLFCHSNVKGLGSPKPSWSGRSDVKGFSAGSAIRMRRFLRESVAVYTVFITLTYPLGHGDDGVRAKRDLKCFLQRYRRSVEQSDFMRFGAFWFMEFQERGIIHFHIFGTHRINKEDLSAMWYEIVGSEDHRHARAGTNVQAIRSGRGGICSYASKYASKMAQKKVPDGFGWVGRYWGVAGERARLVADTFVNVQSVRLPSIRRRVKQLELALEAGVWDGKCKSIHCKRDNLLLWSISDKKLRAHVSALIQTIQMTVMLYNPGSEHLRYPELYAEDLSCQ